MIARIKGLKISQASERTAVTGQEMIPFQDGERNGKIRMIEFKDMTMYIFDPTIVDGKVSQEDYDALKQAIEEGKLIYTINSNRNGLDLATEVAIVGGTIYIESPDFIKEEGTDNISQVVFDTITVDGSLNYSKEQYTTTVIKTTGDGTKVLTDNGQYVYIGNLALTNIKFKDGTNTSTYDLVTNGITFRQNSTPCVSWNTIKSGNNIYMDIRIANATASMDGLMSKEDYVELNTTIPGQIEDLKEADSNINNRIDDLDDKIDKEIADREAEIDRIENKFDGVTDKLEDALQKEIEDRKAGDTTITNSLNAFISTKGQPGGLAELDSTGKVPAAQLPSYVDDVLEFSTKDQFPQTGETGKIYVAKDTNLTYRWTGTQYLEISQSLALGETPSTAYPGDKGKANRDALNSMPTKLTSYLTPTTSTGELVKINYKYAAKDGLNYGPLQDDNIDIPSATTTNAGAMSAIDKGRLDDLYNEFGSIQNPGDKLDSLPKNLVTGVDATSRNATSVTINYKQSDLSTASNSYANPITKSQTIPSANQTQAGVMTATDKQNLDVNIPNRITNLDNRVTTEVDRLEELIESSSSEITNDLNVEIQARKDGDAQLQTNINNLQSTMNTELAKKVGKVTVAGSGNAVTTASISGDTLTLTKGATYNNYVHPAGSAPSKASGFYKFSTDSTSHVASVTAVTKADITALGIPAQNTNTTYTFANGSAGNFTVTPSGGSAQTVSVGKPANAGNADTVGGISPSAFVKKAGDTMTGVLSINQTSSVTPLTLHGTDISSYIQFINSGTQTAEVGYTNSLGTYLYNDKLTTHPCISLGRVDSLDEGATFYYGGTHYKLLHKGNYANELDQRYSPKMVYNYDKGCLVKLRNASSVDAMITVRIFGNSYYTTPPFDTVIQFYNYNTGNSIIQYSGVNNGAGFGDIKVFNYNGQVYLWFKQTRQFQSFVVHAYYSNSSDYRNMVESISNAAMPTSGVTRTVTITPKQAIYAGDDIVRAAGSINIERTNEVNSYNGNLYLNHRNMDGTGNIIMCGNGGAVMIGGNAEPSAKLHVYGNILATGNIKSSAQMVARYISFNNSDGNNAGYIGSGSPADNDLYFISQRDNGIHISANNNTPTGGINLTANTNLVSIGAVTATEKLHVVGNIKATGKVSAAGGFFKESDARLKTDIKPLDYTLDQICSIPTVSFIMNDQKQIGTVAQDLEELGFKDIVDESITPKSEVSNPEQFESFTKDGEEYVKVKKVEYEMLGVLAIEGVKMLKDEIEKLKAEIETLKNKQHE